MLIRRPRRVTPQFVATAAAVAAAAVIGSRAVDPDSAWYRSLEKPRWQPPRGPSAWCAFATTLNLAIARSNSS